MTKTIKDLVKDLSAEINSILRNGQETIDDQSWLIYLSCEFNLSDVYVLITKHKDDNAIATEENLRDFIQFANKMWESSKNTQKIPHLKTNTHINQFTLKLVIMLAELLVPKDIEDRPKKIEEKIWKLYISTLERYDFGNINNIHHYVMSDNNKTMINVFECLREYEMRKKEEKNKKIKHTHPIEGEDGQEYLSDTELQRVLTYSSKLKNYYDILMQDKEDDKLGQARREAKLVVHDKSTIIGYSYGLGNREGNLVGWEKLKYQIYGNIHTCNDYLKRLYRLPLISWEPFCSNIKLNDFTKYLTGKDEKDYSSSLLPPLMANDELYSATDEKHNRSVLYSFFLLYWRKRKLEPKYTGYLSSLSWDREAKCNAAQKILKFIISGKPLSEFQSFLDSAECKSYLPALTRGYTNPWETLPLMVEVMKKICLKKLKLEATPVVEKRSTLVM